MAADIGIDLGTASVLVYLKGKGVVLKEPSVVAYDRDSHRIKAIGEDAKLMLARAEGNIVEVRPLRKGVVADYTVTEAMMKYFVKKASSKRMFRKPSINICVPIGVTEVERKTIEEAAYAAGASEVFLIDEPVAAAIGAGIDVMKPFGNLVVDIGGGSTDVAVISLGGAVVNASLKVGGNDFDDAIIRYLRERYNLLIGYQTAEAIKIQIGSVYPLVEEEMVEVNGRSLTTGLPETVVLSSSETEAAFRDVTNQIVNAVLEVLGKTPPELASDILDRGILLTGGGSLLRGFEELIEERTGINTMTAEYPMLVVAIGTGQYVNILDGRNNED